MPVGLKEQIDDLDQLLDKLLKLPIDRVQNAPATLPLKPKTAVALPGEVEETHERPILRFEGVDEQSKPLLTLADESECEEDEIDEVVDHGSEALVVPHEIHATTPSLSIALQEVESPISQTDTSSNEPLTSNPSLQKDEGSQTRQASSLPTEEIPWIDDEPLPGGRTQGPRVEIIMGPTSDVVVSSGREEMRPSAPSTRRRGWVYWLFWTVTWCFDNTLGHWFPWLRRPSVKFLLGLVGVVLFAVSIYLVWIGWLR